jgi:DNA segregation ATPase FtsK/SpoIIIE, S-DNA-T family
MCGDRSDRMRRRARNGRPDGGLWITSLVVHRFAKNDDTDPIGLHTRSVRVRLSICEPLRPVRDVLISARDGVRLRDVMPELLHGRPRTAADLAVWSGSTRIPLDAQLGAPSLRNGTTLHLGHRAEGGAPPPAPRQVSVVGGPDAGLTFPLRPGDVVLGRHTSCDLVLSDPEVSRRHAVVTVSAAGVCVRDLSSTNGTLIDGRQVAASPEALGEGAVLSVGASSLAVSERFHASTDLDDAPDGAAAVHRPPRQRPPAVGGRIDLPDDPASSSAPRTPWLAALLPAALGCALATAFHAAQYLAFALLSPVMLLGTAAGDRWHWRRHRRRTARTHRERLAAAERRRADLLAAETTARRLWYPDAAAMMRTASGPDRRLWERRCDDDDALTGTVGLVARPSRSTVRTGAHEVPAGEVRAVPCPVDLRRGPVGLVGPIDVARGCARWLVAQLAVAHSPADLTITPLVSASASDAWTWMRWLPHVRPGDQRRKGTSENALADVQALVSARLSRRPPGADTTWPGPWTVVVLDRADDFAREPGLDEMLSRGPRVGVTAVCVDEYIDRLPPGCLTIVAADNDTGTRFVVHGAVNEATDGLHPDQVSTEWAETVARALAPLVDVSTSRLSGVPTASWLVDILQLGESDWTATILERWQRGSGRPATYLGVDATGPVEVDLVRDGPHALVAGTTGSGKSELLQSLIAGLAVSCSPSDVSFILIDYKGGAAFADCARLPHATGLVTDLDGHLTRRALRSLEAELRRRESLLAQAGAPDLERYRTTENARVAPLARLILVVDEFAALKEELPDFVDGLVDVAQRGRSLGLHLVLATQRPTGVVSPAIKANTSLRIALRVTDPAESDDIVASSEAATIERDRPGRAYVRRGSTLTEMQTARVADHGRPRGAITVQPLDEWGCPDGARGTGASPTDLHLVVAAAREASVRAHATTPSPPWLPPLPDLVRLDDITPAAETDRISIGVVDLPDLQRQVPLELDLASPEPTLLIGGAGSGRTMALVTAAVAAGRRLSPDQLAVYAIDGADGSLGVLVGLPHCRAALSSRNLDTIEQMIAELAERGTTTTATGENTTSGPHALLIVDGWEGLVAAAEAYDSGRTIEALLGLIREAGSRRMTVLVAGDRTTLAPRLSGLVERKFVLRLADRMDYALAGIPIGRIPIRMPPGRAIRSGDHAEVHFAVPASASRRDDQRGAVADVAALYPGIADEARLEFRPLPTRVRLQDLPRSGDRLVVGVGGDRGDAVLIDLFAAPGAFLVAGPPRSGRTTALTLMARQLATKDVDVVVVTSRASALREVATATGAVLAGPQADQVVAAAKRSARRVFLVDDAESLLDTVVGDALAEVVVRDEVTDVVVVAARTDDLAVAYRGLLAVARRGRTGLLLQPGPTDGDAFGLRLPRTQTAATAGRGLLVGDLLKLCGVSTRGPLPVQVAIP